VTTADQWDRNREGYELLRLLWESDEVTWSGRFRPSLVKAKTLTGDDLERWALKLLLNHAAGKAFSANQGKIDSPIPPVAIDFLLGKTVWPKGLGLCVAGDPENGNLKFDPFTKLEHTLTNFWGAYPILWHEDQTFHSGIADRTLGGGIVELNGYSFGLSILPIHRGRSAITRAAWVASIRTAKPSQVSAGSAIAPSGPGAVKHRPS
jgi:hypothetical protein